MQTKYYEETATKGKLSFFSVYADYEAGRRAKQAVSTITNLAGQHWRFASEMWRLDLLTNEPVRRAVTDNAANADVLIVAFSSLEHRPFEMINWFDFLATRKPGRSVPGLLVGLLGDEENQSQELGWTVKQLIRCAQKTDREFVWHWMGPDALDEFNWLAEPVGMMLARKSPDGQIIFQEMPLGIGCISPARP